MSYFRFTVRFISTPIKSIPSSNVNNNNLLKNSRRGFALVAATTITNNPENTSNQCCKQNYHQQEYRGYLLSQVEPMLSKSTAPVRDFSTLQSHQQQFQKNGPMNAAKSGQKSIVTHEITKNLTLFSDKPKNVDRDPKTLRFKTPVEGPLVLMPAWMLATKKHLAKYAKLYIDLGFNVVTVEITPWQLLWPVKGAQLVAADVVKFLENNPSLSPIVVHGFSVGGYVFGEVMVHMARDMKRYQPVLDRFKAQVWDSAADITEIPIGLPKAIFPKNLTLQKALRNYTIYHLKTFHDQATTHYIRSSQIFHSPIVKAPVLMFTSKNDPIGAEGSNLRVKENYESLGIKVTWKCWEKSAHVLHYKHHREEYLDYLIKHLEAYVMEEISQKSRAKL